MSPPTEDELQQMWSRITNEVKKRKQRRARNRLAVSASFVLLLTVSGFMYYDMQIRDDVYYAERADKKIVLADGSEIMLYRGARLTVEKSFPSDTREVSLEGDAIFKVSKSKDHPFIVHGADYDTKVLGTVFKVSQIGKTFSVDLYEGKVQINRVEKPKETFTIHPQETFTNLGSNKIATVASSSKSKKKEATISLNDVPLSDARKTLEQTYGIELILPKDRESSKITVISENARAENLIRQISLILNLNTKKINDHTYKLEE
ncbi:FecR family protein [Chryseobacterium sp. G0240]|uniref:FecR family protein n=1 Tax=Chryseobacterium sp. G0240 TaxID=2487066 RepID=UPI001620E23D|nr:FecR family protein [Chryseobacterium sp. G0240]